MRLKPQDHATAFIVIVAFCAIVWVVLSKLFKAGLI